MATLRDIKSRVNAIRNIQQITKAMKMVAAVRLRRAQERILRGRPYAHKMEEVLHRLVCFTSSEAHPLLQPRSTGRLLLVPISADKGLCGSFNTNVMRASWDHYRQATGEGKQVFWVAVGRKAKEFLLARSQVLEAQYVHIFTQLSYSHASRIRQDLLRFYWDLGLEEVRLLFSEFKSAGQQRLAQMKLLPIEPADPASCPVSVDYLYEPSAEMVLHDLLPKYLEVQIFHALLESAAAEQAARLAAMEMAYQNAGEMIERLTLLYNRIRQEKITKELLEVVTAGEAIRR
jgi:F-type H+-transporting ATPase subunit gamma